MPKADTGDYYRSRINERDDETMEEYRAKRLPLLRASSEQAKIDLLVVMQEDAASWGAGRWLVGADNDSSRCLFSDLGDTELRGFEEPGKAMGA